MPCRLASKARAILIDAARVELGSIYCCSSARVIEHNDAPRRDGSCSRTGYRPGTLTRYAFFALWFDDRVGPFFLCTVSSKPLRLPLTRVTCSDRVFSFLLFFSPFFSLVQPIRSYNGHRHPWLWLARVAPVRFFRRLGYTQTFVKSCKGNSCRSWSIWNCSIWDGRLPVATASRLSCPLRTVSGALPPL